MHLKLEHALSYLGVNFSQFDCDRLKLKFCRETAGKYCSDREQKKKERF